MAAVKMVNRPPFFDSLAATVRHRDLGNGSSRIEYTYSFTARPAWLRPVLHPVMQLIFHLETKRRLRSLRMFLEHLPCPQRIPPLRWPARDPT